MKLDSILLFEQSPEALEAVKSGNAVVSTGGIRRKGDAGSGFLELAKPASLSVADFQSLFEGKNHALETDSRLGELESRLALSDDGIKEVERIGWLNSAAIKRSYAVTYEGFQRTLQGIESVANQISNLELYIRGRDMKAVAQEAQSYINYMRTDAGHLRSQKYNVTNGSIAEHLDQISAFIKRLLDDIGSNDQGSFLAMQILTNLLGPFSYMVRKYSSLYYFENDKALMPGNYDEWVDTIYRVSKSKLFREKLTYYINLKTSIPFRDKMALARSITSCNAELVSGIQFDRSYIESHEKNEYLAIEKQICEKIEKEDFYIVDNKVVLFLDNGNQD